MGPAGNVFLQRRAGTQIIGGIERDPHVVAQRDKATEFPVVAESPGPKDRSQHEDGPENGAS